MVELFVSRWQNRALETAPVVAVGISRGAPRFRVGYRYRRLPDLYPDGWMLSIEDDERFNEVYRAKLDRIGVDRIAAQLARISDEEGGKPLVLLCYEADPAECHRSVFSSWWAEQTGQELPEMDRGCDQSRNPQPTQDALW